jgi:arylformamidase
MNGDLRLDPMSAANASPLFWDIARGRTLDAWVGGNESAEFLRQSREVADDWGKKGVATEYVAVPGANHFTVLDPLADPASAMAERLAALARQRA